MTSLKENSVNRRPRANTIGDSMDSNSPIGRGESTSSGSFVTKLYKMVDSEPPTIVSWIRNGTAFCIVDPKMMAEHCLPKYFRHRRFSSLIRQLNFYSFYRVQEGQLTIYQHSFFRKGRPDLLSHIKRRGAGKAKDPWFDPLSVVQKPPLPLMSMNPLLITPTQPMETPQRSNVMACYSPMAKPLASSMENMSPALKPGMAHVIPPMVELGGGQEDQEQWGHELIEEEEICIKPETMYSQEIKPINMNVMDIDIQDFLTDDCSIHAGITDKNTRSMEERDPYGSAVMMKRSLVARNCLKWGEKEMETSDTMNNSECTNRNEEDTFEQELLSDLANNVDSNAWEVPLSPLNEEEDVMPWLDLCF